MEHTSNDIANRSISITTLLRAPVEVVWEVWTKPEHIAHWWGPNGFTSTIHKMDVMEGGEWRLTMHAPDGKNYPNKSMFTEIVPMKKIVFQHFHPDFIATIIFEAKENETFMEWSSLFETAELFETIVKVFKADEGMKDNVAKLEKYLEQITAA